MSISSITKGILRRLLFVLLGLIVFVALEESAMWAVGKLFYSPLDPPDVPANVDALRILCVGDSYTYGGLGQRDETYPAQLQTLLDAHVKKVRYQVINKGRCESNTRELNAALPGQLEEYKPHIVVMLIGSANRFNPWDYEDYRQHDSWSYLKSHLNRLSLVTMIRIMWLNHQAAEVTGGAPFQFDPKENLSDSEVPNRYKTYELFLKARARQAVADGRDTGPAEAVWELTLLGDYDKAMRLAAERLETAEGEARIGLELARIEAAVRRGRLDRVETWLETLLAAQPQNEAVLNARAYYAERLADTFRRKGRYAHAIDHYLRAIEFDPSEHHHNYYWLSKLLNLQSRHTPETIYRDLLAMAEREPMLAQSRRFNYYLAMYADQRRWEAGIARWIRDDLERARKVVEASGAKLIVMSYPIDYPTPNTELKRLAELNELTFVDHTRVFETLKPRNRYIMDDDHCSPAGHAVMAENVFKVLPHTQSVAQVK